MMEWDVLIANCNAMILMLDDYEEQRQLHSLNGILETYFKTGFAIC
jgi:hypothetical protein